MSDIISDMYNVWHGGGGGGVQQECDLGCGVGGGQVAAVRAVGGTVAMVQIMDN